MAAFDTGPCSLELMARPELDNPRTGWERNVVLISFHVDDIEATAAELRGRGVEMASEIRYVVGVENPQWRLAQFRDPEGNLFEIVDEPPGWQPGPLAGGSGEVPPDALDPPGVVALEVGVECVGVVRRHRLRHAEGRGGRLDLGGASSRRRARSPPARRRRR